jgi:hypothetical protein
MHLNVCKLNKDKINYKKEFKYNFFINKFKKHQAQIFA